MGSSRDGVHVPGPQRVAERDPQVGEIAGFTHAGEEDQSRAAPFILESDEPPVLLGNNSGPNAVEPLQTLAFCYAVGCVATAAARGIDITRVDFEVEGDFDVQPFLGLDGARSGFTAIRAKGIVSSPNASAEKLEQLCRYVQDTSPVRDCLANPIPVETTLKVTGPMQ